MKNGIRLLAAAMLALVLVLVLLAPAEEAGAQVAVSAEARTGVTFPMGDLSDADAESGLMFGGELLLHLNPTFAGYLGFNRHGFEWDDEVERSDSPRSNSLAAGIKMVFPSPADALLWVRGGLISGQYADDEITADRAVGFEARAGIDMLLGQGLFLVPQLGYHQHGGPGASETTFLSFGVGVHYQLR